MQKEMVDTTGSSMMSCSACGGRISLTDEKCPKCGAEFEEEEHVCGNCGGVISENDAKCPKCGTKLKSPGISGPSKDKGKDKDLMKLNDHKVNMSGKVKCKICGAVYLKKEGSCPECSEE
jgi:rubrerythrin